MTVTPSQLGRPAKVSGEQTRRRIIVATMRCVAEVGYSQATIREIASAAGMTSGSLYHYFANKAELLEATVGEIEDIALPRLRMAAAEARGPVDRIDALFDESDRLLREYPHLAAFERAIRAESGTHLHSGGPKYPGLKVLHDIIGDIVAEARAKDALSRDTEPAAAVNAIYALTRGLMEQAASLPPKTYRTTLRSAKQLIRGTLFAQPKGTTGEQ